MQNRKFVYVEDGIGVLLGYDKSNGYSKVMLSDNSIIMLPHVTCLPDAWSELVSNPINISKLFYPSAYSKGVAYALHGNVKTLSYNRTSNTVSAVVSGTKAYSTVITMGSKYIKSMTCSCPVGNKCKHCAAVLSKLSIILKNSINADMTSDTDSQSIPQNLTDALSKIKNVSKLPDLFREVNLFVDAISESDLSDYQIASLVQDIEKCKKEFARKDAFDLIDIALSADSRVKVHFADVLKNKNNVWKLHKPVFSISEDTYSLSRYKYCISKEQLCSAYTFFPTDSNAVFALSTVCDNSNTSISPDYVDYIFGFFVNYINNTDTVEKIIISNLKHITAISEPAVEAIHRLLSPEFWKILIETYSYKLIISEKLIDKLPTDEQIMILSNLSDKKKVIDYINNHFPEYIDGYPLEIAKALEKTRYLIMSRDYRSKISRLISRLPDSAYFDLYMNNDDSIISAFDTVPYNSEYFFRYFTCDISVSEENDKCVISLSVISPADNRILMIAFDSDFETYSELTGYYPHTQKIHPVSDNEFVSSLVSDILSRYGNMISENKAEIYKKIQQRQKERIYFEMHSSLSVLTDALYSRRIQLLQSQRSTLELSFACENSDCSDMLLSAKLSNPKGKFYVIKNFQKFLSDCREHSTVEYGKGFEFTHILSNFDGISQKAVTILLKSSHPDSYVDCDKRYLPLSPYVINDLLSLWSGQKVIWNSTEYTVRLNSSDYNVNLDENNVISFPLSNDTHELYLSDTILYDINKSSKVIDLIDGTEELHRLFIFAFNHNGQSIEPVINEFKTDVYPRLAQNITVAPEKLSEFKLGNVEIDSYFDYSDRILSLKTVLKKDGHPVTAEKLTALGDKAVYESYTNYIDTLGFSDNCPVNATQTKADAWLDNDASVLSFLSMDFTDLKKYCNVFLSDSIKNKMLITFQPPTIRIKYNSGIMQAFADGEDFTDSELDGILKAIRLKKKYVLLSGDRIVRIDNDESEEFADTVNDLGLDEKSMTEPQKIPVSTSIRALAHEANCMVDDYLLSMINEIKSFKLSGIELPSVNAELRNYQKDGFRWLKILSKYNMGGILADDMGLGKTLEIITLLKSDTESKPCLVVCPKSLIFNWKTEFDRFDSETKVTEIYGTAAERENIISNIDYGNKSVYITSYDSLRNDREKYTGVFNYLILDEAQYIKNIHAQKSQSVKNISAVHRFALTGTPIENNVLDLWSIFDFILPGYFESLKVFKHRYETEKHYPEIISKRVAPFILRRTKKDVLKDLPEKFERILSAEMTAEQKKLYEAYKKSARDKINTGGKAFDMLPILTRMRQICVDPSMFADNYNGGSGKLELLEELLPEYIAAGHRMLIFSQFVKGLESVEKLLNQMKIPYVKLTGDTPSEKRIDMVNEFNNSKHTHVFLISLKAGGTGLNLIGADTVIHLDPWWNVAAENQATDRSHRIGQKKNVEVIKIICSNSVEQRVIELQNSKKDLVDRLISNDESSVMGATLEDIAFIIGGNL